MSSADKIPNLTNSHNHKEPNLMEIENIENLAPLTPNNPASNSKPIQQNDTKNLISSNPTNSLNQYLLNLSMDTKTTKFSENLSNGVKSTIGSNSNNFGSVFNSREILNNHQNMAETNDLSSSAFFSTNHPIVIDNGTGFIKAGFAGGEKPSIIIPSCVGRPKYQAAMASAVEGNQFVGEKCRQLRGILRLDQPMQHGIVKNQTDIEILQKTCFEQLHSKSSEHPVLLTEAPLNPRQNRFLASELMFENFGVPALYFAVQSILSLYSSGRTTGIVLDCGDGVTHCVPVYEGFALPHSIVRMDLAGRDVTTHLRMLLQKSGYTFYTSSEMETVRDIKEQVCIVAFNIDKIEQDSSYDTYTPYKLPDGKIIQVGRSKFRAPEVLFNPQICGKEYEGVHKCLSNSIELADLDLRRQLYSQIVLSGGSTLFPGFGERLLSEMRRISPKDTKIRIFAPSDRILSTQIGGSILASLATFKKVQISKAEYEECGKSIIFRKTF